MTDLSDFKVNDKTPQTGKLSNAACNINDCAIALIYCDQRFEFKL